MLTNEIAIDLGTANIVVYEKNKGIIMNEPSVVAIDRRTKKIIAFGHAARDMIGKIHPHIQLIRPLKNGVIADFDITTELLKIIMKKKLSQTISIRKPNILICTPSGATSVDKRALEDVARNAGAKQVTLIEAPVAAAIGTGLPVDEPIANMIVDIGAGSTEVAIISFGGVVAYQSIHIGGDHFDEEIIQYVKKQYNILIGERTAERIKTEIGYALVEHDLLQMEVRGRDLVTGLPKTITLTSYEIRDTLKDSFSQIHEAIRVTLEKCPAELSGDIVDRGVILVGGGSMLHGMEEWLSKEIFVPVILSQHPLESVAMGMGEALHLLKKLLKVGK